MNHNRIRSIIRKIGITIFISYMFMKLRDIIVNGGKLVENELGDSDDSTSDRLKSTEDKNIKSGIDEYDD